MNQSLSGAVTLIRIGILLASSFLGVFGFIVSVFAVLIGLASLRSFGVPYLAPISPVTWKDLSAALIRLPSVYQKKRPVMMRTVDSTRGEGDGMP